MTREEAIGMLKAKLECMTRDVSGCDDDCNSRLCGECHLNYEKGTMGEQKEYLRMSIKALEQQPCEDAISRQAVLEGLRTCYDTETKEYSDGSQWINYEDAVAEMENLPPVTPQPKIGKWIKHDTGHSIYHDCSLCGCVAPYTETADRIIWKLSNYCPDCGAKMEAATDADSD